MVMREFASGVGFVDVGISFGATLHLVELKILTGTLTAASQVATYMAMERRTTGWLLPVERRRAAPCAEGAPVRGSHKAGRALVGDSTLLGLHRRV